MKIVLVLVTLAVCVVAAPIDDDPVDTAAMTSSSQQTPLSSLEHPIQDDDTFSLESRPINFQANLNTIERHSDTVSTSSKKSMDESWLSDLETKKAEKATTDPPSFEKVRSANHASFIALKHYWEAAIASEHAVNAYDSMFVLSHRRPKTEQVPELLEKSGLDAEKAVGAKKSARDAVDATEKVTNDLGKTLFFDLGGSKPSATDHQAAEAPAVDATPETMMVSKTEVVADGSDRVPEQPVVSESSAVKPGTEPAAVDTASKIDAIAHDAPKTETAEDNSPVSSSGPSSITAQDTSQASPDSSQSHNNDSIESRSIFNIVKKNPTKTVAGVVLAAAAIYSIHAFLAHRRRRAAMNSTAETNSTTVVPLSISAPVNATTL